ncbi:dTDP-glucose 4,6-dehydratase [Candidatus Poribacteria bacterium]|nr:dTDP-glucose 4,6-dehydratase [Candidatus Poribacteria bacterium]
MATVFVTGGAGFIGSNFVRYWLDNYPEDFIINYDALTYAGNPANLADISDNKSYDYLFVKGDINNYELILHLFKQYKPDYVINFAAESHNSRAVLNPRIFYQTNVLGTQTLLQAARDADIPRFHHISTCEVYGDLPLDSDGIFTEKSPYRPRTPYNSSKAGADMAVRAYYETFHLPVTISNCANNYGPYQFPEKVIPFFTIRVLQGEKMTLYKSSQNKREWLHVSDHCQGIDIILRKGKIGETYNIGSGIEADVETVADLILDTLGLDQSYKTYVEDRPGHDRRYLLDSGKIRRELGWKPGIEFQKGFKDTVIWYKDNSEWWKPLLKSLEVNEDKWKK